MAQIDRALAPEEHQNVASGIALMLLAIFIFSVNDALGKWLAGTYSVGQILLFRGATAFVVLIPFIGRLGPAVFVTVERPGLQVVRVMLSTGEVACFYIAVSVLPLADTMTYYLASPIFVTVLAAVMLREEVGWRRWSAVIVGFAGVVLALQPSALLGYSYLLLYNFIFVFPLIAILLLASAPPTLKKLAHWNLHHKEWVRLTLGASVVGMGLLILATV